MQALVLPLAFQGHGQTLRIKATQAGLNFFIFEGMRFIVGDGKLYMATLTAGTTLQDFHQVRALVLVRGAMLTDQHG